MSCAQCPLRLLPAMCSKSHRDDISFQLLLGSSASSTESELNFPFCTEDSHLPVREVSLNFYLDDGSVQRMVVEENLRAADLCHLLALKVNVTKSHTWTLVEHLGDMAIERCIEDHEDVLGVYSCWGKENDSLKNKFIFRQDFRKYEFFHSPQQFFPLPMLDLGEELDCLSESTEIAKIITLQNLLNSGEKAPCVQSYLWCKDAGKQSWRRLYFRVEGSTLYTALAPNSKMVPCRDLQQHNVFIPTEPLCNGAPKQYSLCLKACSTGYSSGLIWFCADSERQRQCWVVAFRLARFGKRLRENYKEFRSRYADQGESLQSEYGTPLKGRVAMDFTGGISRVVDDPKEAEAIAAAEGHVWKRRLPCSRLSPTPLQTAQVGDLQQSPTGGPARGPGEFGVHTIQPWFYSGMGREEATQLLTKYGTVDGVFLVRESRRNVGSFVLCYVYNNKVHHTQIIPVEEKDQLCFSVDAGRTKFYDLLQLVEFYQLNLGCLPTKLTHFLVHRLRNKDSAK